jgi:hypothetical protein
MQGTVIKMSVQRMVCTGCGSEANASCTCGVSYVPKLARAAESIKADPNRSDGSIAAELGIARQTVSNARKQVASDLPPDEESERIGIDGKTYPVKPRLVKEQDEDKIGLRNLRSLLLMNSAACVECAVYEGPIDAEIIMACRRAASAWDELANNLEQGKYHG